MISRQENQANGIKKLNDQWWLWALCVMFASLPLLIFLGCLELVPRNGLLQDSALKIAFEEQGFYSPFAGSLFSIGLIGFAVYNFIHICVCLGTGVFFIAHLYSFQKFAANITFCIIFSAVVGLSVYLVTSHETAFRAVMLNPLEVSIFATKDVLVSIHNTARAFSSNEQVKNLLVIGLLIPTSLGIIVVVLATASAHARIFFTSKQETENDNQDIERLMMSLRLDIYVLSAVLVSAVLTARAYFSLSLWLLKEKTEIYSLYSDILHTASFASGLLFSITLAAAFAPYFFLVMREKSGMSGQQSMSSTSREENSGESHTSQVNFREILQPIIALVAPAIVTPVIETYVMMAG